LAPSFYNGRWGPHCAGLVRPKGGHEDEETAMGKVGEWARFAGHYGIGDGVRGYQPHQAGNQDGPIGEQSSAGSSGHAGGGGVAGRRWGSEELGLGELELLVYESDQPGGCGYSRLVFAGWEARCIRASKRGSKVAQLPGQE